MEDHKLQSLKTVIRTRDFDASKHFYILILKLAALEQYEEKGAKGCILKFDSEPNNAFVEISEIAPDDDYFQSSFAVDSQTDKFSMQIKTDNVDYWAKRLKETGWEARGPVKRPWGYRYL